MGCAVSTDRLLAKFVSQAEPIEGSDYDTIDLTPAQGRKGAGMAWAELGEPIFDGLEPDDWVSDNDPSDIDTSESELDPRPEETEPLLGENLETNQYIGDELVDNGTTVLGTTGNDVMTATQRDDVIAGGSGDDRITLMAGYDIVKAGAGDDFILASSNDADAQNVAYGMAGDDTMDATGFVGPWLVFDGNEGHDTLLVSGGPQDYAIEQTVRDRVVHDNGEIEWESHELILTKTGADGSLLRVQAGNIEQVIFSDGTTWERADDSAELFPLA